MSKLEQTIFEMMTTSTGTALCDSGGANGRHWQKNQKLTIEDFKNQPPAILEFWNDYPEYTVNVFHKLTDGSIELDALCNEFNAIECDVWNGEYYGTNADQCQWLEDNRFEVKGDGFNTYNWGSNLSQTLQGYDVERDGEYYILLQIHQGADVRGGYTDAKLFKVSDYCEPYYVICDDASFTIENASGDYIGLDYRGEWFDFEGNCATDDYFKQFATLANNKPVNGDIMSH